MLSLGDEEAVMSIGRICQREVDLAQVDENVSRAAERMHQRTVGSLVVVNDDQKPVGIVTDRGLTIRVLARARPPSPRPRARGRAASCWPPKGLYCRTPR